MAEFASKYETLILKRERSRLHVTLNRPEVKNALNPTLIGELRAVFDILRERCLFYVACTRARDELLVTGSGAASSMLPT